MTMTLRSKLFACGFATLPCALAYSDEAHASPELSVRGEVAPVLTDNAKNGIGGTARLGFELPLPLVFISPHVGAGYYRFSGKLQPDLAIVPVYVGARAGLGSFVRPYVEAHIGGASRSFDLGVPPSSWSSYFDVGAGLGVRPVRTFEVGAHANLAFVGSNAPASSMNWLGLGVDLSVYF